MIATTLANMPVSLNLIMGALAPPLRDQIREQKLRFDANTIRHFQRDMDAITRLAVRQLLSPSIRAKLNEKLFKQIVRYLSKVNSRPARKRRTAEATRENPS